MPKSSSLIKSQSRIQYNQKYPNNGVRCTVCQLIFTINDIQSHMASHIAPSYMAPKTRENNLKKITKPKIYLQQKQNNIILNDNNVDQLKKNIKQLPKYQKLRYKREVPEQNQLLSINNNNNNNNIFAVHYNNNSITGNYNNVIGSNKQINDISLSRSTKINDRHTNFNIQNIQHQIYSPQIITQKLNIDKQDYNIKINNITTYQTKQKQKQKQKYYFNHNTSSSSSGFRKTSNSYNRSFIRNSNNNQNIHNKTINENENEDESITTQGYKIQIQKQNKHNTFFNNLIVKNNQQEEQKQKVIQIQLQSYKPYTQIYQPISTKQTNKLSRTHNSYNQSDNNYHTNSNKNINNNNKKSQFFHF